MSALRFSLPLVLMAALFAGCPDAGNRPLGDSCDSSGDCASGLCSANRCLDPSGDDDLDGITNGVEAALGSNPLEQDSDLDGQLDGDEIASDQAGIDTDGDGRLDVVESRTRDVDGDCISDQYDAQDDIPNTDLSPMRPAVCNLRGICAEQQERLRVACPAGVAVCIYDDIVGYAEPESSCDQIDENCDGRVDEGFPPNCLFYDWDSDGIKDAFDVCPETSDVGQKDSNGDGIGDACNDLYEVAFEPSPPTALTVGEAFNVGAAVRRKGGDNGAPLPRFKGRVSLATTPASRLQAAQLPVENAFNFVNLTFSQAGTFRFQLQSTLGTTESGDVVVAAGPATRLSLVTPAEVTAGESFDVDGVAYDSFDNVADFDDAAVLEADLAAAFIPPAGRFADGTWALSGMSLATAGDTVLTLTAGGLEAQATVRVRTGPVGEIRVELAESVAAAAAVPVTISVRDASGNLATGFRGVVALGVDDPRSSLPASVSFGPQDGGTRTISVTFGTLGVRTVTATQDGFSGDGQTTVKAGAPHHLVLTTDGAATTGVPQAVTVAVVDAYEHPISDPAAPYLGKVTFSVSGTVPNPAPTLPGPTTFAATDLGTIDVATTWYRQGVWRLRATGTGLVVPNATVEIDVSLSPGVTLELSVPPSAKAGVPTAVTVTMRDGQGNIATGFTGTVVFPDDHNRSNLPTLLPLDVNDAGTRTIQVTFVTAGQRSVTARVGPLNASANLVVLPGSPHAIRLSAPGPAVSGQPQGIQISVVDRYGNAATDPADSYLGSASFDLVGNAPSMPPALPATMAFLPANQSAASAEVTWQQAGTYTLRVTGTNLEVPQATASVKVLLATALEVTLPASVKSGVPVEVTVRALGLNAATARNFVGLVTVRDDDGRSVMPASIYFASADLGVKSFTATFFEVGARTVNVSGNGVSGSGTTNVLAGAPAAIRLSVTGTATTSVPKAVRVTVVDAIGQVANDPADAYVGTVSFDVAGLQPEVAPALPGSTTFTAGDLSARDFTTTWFRVGTYSLRVTGTGLPSGVATANLVVIGTPANSLELSLPSTTTTDADVPLTVTVRDSNGDIATGFADTIRLTTGSGSTLPATIAFGADDAGTRTINVRFGRTGVQTVTATWQAVSARASITVLAGAPAGIVLLGDNTTETGAPLPVRVVIVDAGGNAANNPAKPYLGTVSFTSTGPTPTAPYYLPPLPPSIPAPRVFTAGDGGNTNVVTRWFRPGRYSLRATATNLTRATASLGIEASVGEATMLDIIAPPTFVAGTSPSARVHATDAYRNIAPDFDGNVTIGGSDELDQDELELVAGVAVPSLYLTMQTAGDYVITADGGGLHGEAAVTVTAGQARFMVVTGPDEVSQDDNVTLHVRFTDVYENTATDFDGNVTVRATGQATYYDANPILFGEADRGERDFLMRIFVPGQQTVSFSSYIDGVGQANETHAITVLSNLGPSELSVRRLGKIVEANVPFEDGFLVQLIDSNGDPTSFSSPINVTTWLGEMAPGPATLTGTLNRVIPARRSSVLYDDLVFDRDGRFTLAASPDIDLRGGESARFVVHYRAPTINLINSTDVAGCVRIDYTVSQADNVPVDLDVQFYDPELEALAPARQAASTDGVNGHYRLPTSGGPSYSYLWNATHDLPNADGLVGFRVRARAGSRYIDNPWGSADRTMDFVAEGRLCQSDVSAMLAAPAWPSYDETDFFGFGIAPRTFAAGDVNGDGKLDLVLGHLSLTGVSIALGRGDGGFEPDALIVASETFTSSPLDVALGDFDGDGRTDIATAGPEEGIEFMRQGDAGFEFYDYFANDVLTQRIAAGDLDGNGVDDLVYLAEDGNITVAYSNGASFEHVLVGRNSPAVLALDVMNADNHGGLDIAYQALINDDGINQQICVITTSINHSYFSDPVCRTVLYYDSGVSNFAVDPNPLDNRLFFSLEDEGRRTQVLVYNEGFDYAHNVDRACDYSEPGQFAVGNFESWDAFSGDPMTDLATSCSYYGDMSLDFFMMSNDANETVRVDDIDFGSGVSLIAKDFTGDGADDVATRRGVLRTVPSPFGIDYTDVRRPVRDTVNYEDENATLAGDFNGNLAEEVVTLTTGSDYDGNVTLDIDSRELYNFREYEFISVDICTSQCQPSGSFRVLAAKGDINGDGRPDIVYATGAGAATGLVGAVGSNGQGFVPIAIPALGGDFYPATLTVGDLFDDGDQRDDIIVGGYNSAWVAQLVVFHWDTILGAFVRYSGSQLPNDFRGSFVGDFLLGHAGKELVLVDRGPEANATAFAPDACTPQNLTCIVPVSEPTSLLGGLFENAYVDGVAAGDFDGSGNAAMIIHSRFDEDSGTTYEVRVVSLNFGARTLAVRRFNGTQLCKVGTTYQCAEPGAGPLIGDLDRDGTDDILIGWENGRNWEALTAQSHYMFGGTVSERGQHVLLSDIDSNGLLDVLVLEPDSANVWMLGQDLYPPIYEPN